MLSPDAVFIPPLAGEIQEVVEFLPGHSGTTLEVSSGTELAQSRADDVGDAANTARLAC